MELNDKISAIPCRFSPTLINAVNRIISVNLIVKGVDADISLTFITVRVYHQITFSRFAVCETENCGTRTPRHFGIDILIRQGNRIISRCCRFFLMGETGGTCFRLATQFTEERHQRHTPYYYADTLLQGFRNSHWIVGGCTQDYGSMTLMPLFGKLRCQPEARSTCFSHEKETATPAYYTVSLPDENIYAEMTGRSRSAIFRFTYSKAGKGYLVVNPNSDEGQGYICIDTLNNQIYGYNPVHRIYQGWGKSAGYSGYFIIQFQKKLTDYGVFRGDSLSPGVIQIGDAAQIGAYVEFDVTEGEEVLVKAASSFTDRDGALKNLKAEIPHWDFGQTCTELRQMWEKHLSAIDVETERLADKEMFYGAFYRASFLPHTFNDIDGRYPSFANGTPSNPVYPPARRKLAGVWDSIGWTSCTSDRAVVIMKNMII